MTNVVCGRQSQTEETVPVYAKGTDDDNDAQKEETIPKLSRAIDEMENLGTELLLFKIFLGTQKNKILVS